MLPSSQKPTQTNGRQALVVSLLLHGGGLLFLVLMVLVQSLQRTPPEHVFELVEIPPTMVSQDNEEPAAEVNLVQPRPQLQPLAAPQPRPQPRPVVLPEPAPALAPELITADQFRREFGRTEPQPRPQERRRLEVPRIETDRLQEELQQMVVSTSRRRVETLSSADQDAISRYIATLRGRINAVWEQPANYSGNLREVVVLFDVDPSGRITRVRLESGSAGDPFAQSVLRAFDRVAPVGPTPERQSYTFRLPFRMVDR